MSKKKKKSNITTDDKIVARIEPAKTKEEIEAEKWVNALPKELQLSIMAYPPDAKEIKGVYESAPNEHVLAEMTKLRSQAKSQPVMLADVALLQAELLFWRNEIKGLKAGAEFHGNSQQTLLSYTDAVAKLMIEKGVCTEEEMTRQLEKFNVVEKEVSDADLGDAGMGNKQEEPGTPESPAGEQGTDPTSR